MIVDSQITDDSPNLYNVVLAEEFAHLVLHDVIINRIQVVDDFLEIHRHPDWMVAERDAKRFMRALLLPIDEVEARVSDAYKRVVARDGFVDVMQCYVSICVSLAFEFRVTPQVASERLSEVPSNLLEKIYFSFAIRSDSLQQPRIQTTSTVVRKRRSKKESPTEGRQPTLFEQ